MEAKYKLLKQQLEHTPDDDAIATQMNEVEDTLNQIQGGPSTDTLNPAKECYRVCVNPHLKASAGNIFSVNYIFYIFIKNIFHHSYYNIFLMFFYVYVCVLSLISLSLSLSLSLQELMTWTIVFVCVLKL